MHRNFVHKDLWNYGKRIFAKKNKKKVHESLSKNEQYDEQYDNKCSHIFIIISFLIIAKLMWF